MLQPAPSPLAHSRSSPAADARRLYATVLAVAGNAAGMCSGTVLFIGIVNLINHILLSVGILQNIFIHFCIVQSSFFFVSFQVLAVGHLSYCLLCYCQLWHAVWSTVCHLSYCLHCLPSVSPTVCHPSSVRRSLVSAAPLSAYLAILYHYRHFHNYLLISVTYIFNFKGY